MNSSSASTNSALSKFNSASYLTPKTNGRPAKQGFQTKHYKYSDYGSSYNTWIMMNPPNVPPGGTFDWNEAFESYMKWSAKLLAVQFKTVCFTFGKYNGHPIEQVLAKDLDYCQWVAFEVPGSKRAEARMLEKWFWSTGAPASRQVRKNPSSDMKWSRN